jgi:hypothetical protein
VTEREQEQLLRDALQRMEPPDGFADRVMARLPHATSASARKPNLWARWLSPPKLGWNPAMAALLVALLGAGSWEYADWRDRRVRAEHARNELIEALEITTGKVQATKARLFRSPAGGLL